MKCKYCSVQLPGDWRDYEHVRICKNVTPEVREIHSGIEQKKEKSIISEIEGE